MCMKSGSNIKNKKKKQNKEFYDPEFLEFVFIIIATTTTNIYHIKILLIQKTGPTFLKFIWFVSDDDYDITTTTQSTRVIYACN